MSWNARPRHMIADEQMLVGAVSPAGIDKRETESARHDRIRRQFVSESPPVYRRRPIEIRQTHLMLRTEIVIEPRLTIGKSENEWRLITKINSIQDVLKIALAEVHQP